MVLFKYTGGGQIEAPPFCASDVPMESQPKTGKFHNMYVSCIEVSQCQDDQAYKQ